MLFLNNAASKIKNLCLLRKSIGQAALVNAADLLLYY
jgi:hypothetical protein